MQRSISCPPLLPLAVADPNKLSLLDLFMGVHGGVLGETCALAIVLGLIYLVVTKTISIAIPAAYVAACSCSTSSPPTASTLHWWLC